MVDNRPDTVVYPLKITSNHNYFWINKYIKFVVYPLKITSNHNSTFNRPGNWLVVYPLKITSNHNDIPDVLAHR